MTLLFKYWAEDRTKKDFNRARGQKENYVATSETTNLALISSIIKRCPDEAHLYPTFDQLWGKSISLYRRQAALHFKIASAILTSQKKRKFR